MTTTYDNPERGRQLNLFNLRQKINKRVSATDIDFAIEVKDKFLILGDLKYGNKGFTGGQKILLERLAKAWSFDPSKKSSVFRIEHHVHNTDIDVQVADCLVTDYFVKHNGEWGWHKANKPQTVIEALRCLDNAWGGEGALDFEKVHLDVPNEVEEPAKVKESDWATDENGDLAF